MSASEVSGITTDKEDEELVPWYGIDGKAKCRTGRGEGTNGHVFLHGLGVKLSFYKGQIAECRTGRGGDKRWLTDTFFGTD